MKAPSFRLLSLAVLIGAGFACLLVISAASIWLVRKWSDDTRWVTHSLDVQNQVSLLQLAVRRAESGQRGMLLTDNPAYPTVFRQSFDLIGPRLDGLRGRVVDNPDQVGRIEALTAVVASKIAEMQKIEALRAAGRQADAVELIRSPDGPALMDQFTTMTGALRDAESALLVDRLATTRATGTWLLATTIFGSVAILLLAAASILVIRRSTATLVRAQAALREANEHLEEKVAERTSDLQAANDELQRFAYIVSHDLRSPLVNIMGFTGELDAIRKELGEPAPRPPGEADPRQAALLDDFDEALGFIKSSIGKMDRLIHAILALSRAGRRDFVPERLDLNIVVASIRDALAHQVQDAKATIDIGDLPTIESDRVAVEQIFSNLLDNAVKYLENGRPGEVAVTAVERIGFAVIRVADNGRGIAEADRDRVFDLFRRAGIQDRPGEGIGLAHVRALVRRLGGSIRLESEPGRGSTFIVILPLRWRQS